MPFCPNCRMEYVEGITECTDCETGLVAELPPATPSAEDLTHDYELLVEPSGEIDTFLIVAELQAASIPYVLTGDELDTVMIYPARDSKIWVPKSELAKAKEIVANSMQPLEKGKKGEKKDQEIFSCDNCGAEVPEDAKKCPKCGEALEEEE